MSTTLDDVLLSICDDVTLSLTTEFQKVYVVKTTFQAKLAYEILVVFGLDVKFYHQDDKPTKLYITHPEFSDAQAEKTYGAALSYAKALRQISDIVDDLVTKTPDSTASEYDINFLKNSPSSKQILIQMASITGSKPKNPVAASASAPQTVQKTPAKPAETGVIAESQQRAARKYGEKKQGHYEELSSGPSVARRSYPGKLNEEGEAQANSTRRRIMLLLFGNMTQGSGPAIVMAIAIAIIFSILVMFRGFICVDLANANLNKAWYCKIGKEEPKPKRKRANTINQR